MADQYPYFPRGYLPEEADEERHRLVTEIVSRYLEPAQAAAPCSISHAEARAPHSTDGAENQPTKQPNNSSSDPLLTASTSTQYSSDLPKPSTSSSIGLLDTSLFRLASDMVVTLASQLSLTTSSQDRFAASSGSPELSVAACDIADSESSDEPSSVMDIGDVLNDDLKPFQRKSASDITPKGDVHPGGTTSKRRASDTKAGAGVQVATPASKEARWGEGREPKLEMMEGEQSAVEGECEETARESEEEEKMEEDQAPERERKEYAEKLIKVLNAHQRNHLLPETERLLRQLSREKIIDMLEEIDRTDMIWSRHRWCIPPARLPPASAPEAITPPRRVEVHSDEDSDEDNNLAQRIIFGAPVEGKFAVTDHQKLQRLLILGGAQKATVQQPDPTQNPGFAVVNRLIAEGSGVQVVEMLKDVSVRGRTAKQDGTLFALALCCRSSDMATKQSAYLALQDICRIPTQLFQFIKYVESVGQTTGWGRGLRRAVCKWYNGYQIKPLLLALHVTKYWSRHGWCHRDVFRLSHIKPVNDTIGFIVRQAVKTLKEAEEYYLEDGYLGREDLEKVHKYLQAVEEAKQCLDAQRTVQLIQEHGLVREQLRTEMLNETAVWRALLPDMPLTALIRNLGKMSSLKEFSTEGFFDDKELVQLVISKLSNVEAMKKARVHPFKILLAHHIYQKGQGDKGHLTWKPNMEIVQALEKAFYQSFQTLEPTNKRILVALDISGSMGSLLMGSPIQVREAATVMAMVTIKTEPHCDIVGFHQHLLELDMFRDPQKTLNELIQETHSLGFGLTDCSKPMTWARRRRKEYDAFIILTDCETNVHKITPYAALEKYRKAMNKPTAKLIVVGMLANDFTIASPDDLHMLDVVGFDPDTPDIIREFLIGGLD